MANENKIAFQGLPGAFSDMSCRIACPEMAPLPCATFEDTFQAVHDGKAERAMIPIENTVAGRVADIHQIMPNSGLHIIGENFQRVQHQLLGRKGATLEQLETVHSHVHALSQCRKTIRELGLRAVVHADTAGAAMDLATSGKESMAAIASALAAETYGLDILQENIEDEDHNTTRFVIMAKEPIEPDPNDSIIVTSFVFRVRNVPAALYKALGGFATNGVNMTKLESYMLRGEFTATQFYVDIEGHPDDELVRLALDELSFFSREVKVLGVYPGAPFRMEQPKNG
ncbi:MAG: prephenate dehydratase [Rhodospirillaceae bacterium]|nr:prephenate dehydratase [Rhodospirillaceae bacterium]